MSPLHTDLRLHRDQSRPRGLTIELRDVVREYRIGGQRVRALDRVNLHLTGGHFVSIVGPSGAGKSTLLHLLGALDSPDSGSLLFDGTEIGRLGDEEASAFRRHRVGFVFQFFNLLPTLSAWENVAVPKLLDGSRLDRVQRDAIGLLERVGLGNRVEHRPAELSGGQLQRVAIARALMMDPSLILADEPTGNLDSATGTAILRLLAEVAHERGRARMVVMVTHDREAAAATDRVIGLQDGRVGSDSGSPANNSGDRKRGEAGRSGSPPNNSGDRRWTPRNGRVTVPR